MSRLNLACGSSRWDGFDNSDIHGAPGTSILDLTRFPYPHKTGTVELILLSHGILHTNNGTPVHPSLPRLLKELHRVLQPGGWLRINENPLRLYRDGEDWGGEANAEAGRGFPDEQRVEREAFMQLLRDTGFREVWETDSGSTRIPLDCQDAILGSHLNHASVAVEARK